MEVYFTAKSASFNLANTYFFTLFCVADGPEMSSAGWAVLTRLVAQYGSLAPL